MQILPSLTLAVLFASVLGQSNQTQNWISICRSLADAQQYSLLFSQSQSNATDICFAPNFPSIVPPNPNQCSNFPVRRVIFSVNANCHNAVSGFTLRKSYGVVVPIPPLVDPDYIRARSQVPIENGDLLCIKVNRPECSNRDALLTKNGYQEYLLRSGPKIRNSYCCQRGFIPRPNNLLSVTASSSVSTSSSASSSVSSSISSSSSTTASSSIASSVSSTSSSSSTRSSTVSSSTSTSSSISSSVSSTASSSTSSSTRSSTTSSSQTSATPVPFPNYACNSLNESSYILAPVYLVTNASFHQVCFSPVYLPYTDPQGFCSNFTIGRVEFKLTNSCVSTNATLSLTPNGFTNHTSPDRGTSITTVRPPGGTVFGIVGNLLSSDFLCMTIRGNGASCITNELADFPGRIGVAQYVVSSNSMVNNAYCCKKASY